MVVPAQKITNFLRGSRLTSSPVCVTIRLHYEGGSMYKLIIVLQSGERIELGDRFHTIEEADREGYRILQESRYADYFEVAKDTPERLDKGQLPEAAKVTPEGVA